MRVESRKKVFLQFLECALSTHPVYEFLDQEPDPQGSCQGRQGLELGRAQEALKGVGAGTGWHSIFLEIREL